jgi:hypothetical protein
MRDSALPGSAQSWHWLSKSIQVQLIPENSDKFAFRKKVKKANLLRAYASLQVAGPAYPNWERLPTLWNVSRMKLFSTGSGTELSK